MRTITYTIADSPLGRVMVAYTLQGVCAIAFADDDELLRAELRSRFKAEQVREEAVDVAHHLQWVLRELAGETQPVGLPLDVRGTAFQQVIWAALQLVPCGETRTYTELAVAVGKPATTARAVAQACAANPVALVIPCHRAVGSDGNLRGFRWGMERKRRLLDRERLSTKSSPAMLPLE